MAVEIEGDHLELPYRVGDGFPGERPDPLLAGGVYHPDEHTGDEMDLHARRIFEIARAREHELQRSLRPGERDYLESSGVQKYLRRYSNEVLQAQIAYREQQNTP